MQIKDLMWEMFRSTGHINAYLLYKEYEKGEFVSEITGEMTEPYKQKIPIL